MCIKKIIKYALTYLWLLSSTLGLAVLINYSNTKGKVGSQTLRQWPAESRIERTIQPTLVMFVHPFCPCSMASVGELERLMPYLKDKVNINLVFISLKNMKGASATEWKSTALYKKAAKIPGIKIFRDSDDSESKLFGAETSGHTEIFDQKGKLVFTGGITPARGHMGDSPGRTAIVSWLKDHNETRVETSVFGCALRAPATK